MKGLATRYAPSFALVRAHLGFGIVGSVLFAAALGGAAWNLEGHYFQGKILGLVHLCALGWILPIAFGAMLQLVPVLFEVPLRSERTAWAALGLYAIGGIGFVGHIALLATVASLPLSAFLLFLGVLLHATHLALSALANPVRARSLTGLFVLSALAWLVFAASLGFMLAIHLWHPYLSVNHLMALRAHAHAAGLGFFGLLIMGVGFELLEMFLLSHGAPAWPGWGALALVNVGLVALCWNFLAGPFPDLALVGAAAIALGVVCFAIRVQMILARRMRRHLDASAWLSSGSVLCLLGALVVAGTLSFAGLGDDMQNRLVLAYGLLALPGFMGTMVVGQLYKIVPFLIWLHRFSAYVGLKKVPTASELLDERSREIQAALMIGGLLLLLAGVLAGQSLLRLAGAATFFAAMVYSARNFLVVHGRRP
ncbi:MAG: hypothetical protein B6D46_13635 [Polyangiaceae bacterium UTPRO1]|jgi:hypothetical protein|nr:hypothetical protein [Myxococcales bacterium]OQY65741.1 MAG: hypothetical protein B6D46_13635 [Polyangiaceae bacterium UTPRO1]